MSTLEEYIGICKRYGKRSVLELKSEFADDEIIKIIDIIRQFDYIDSVVFISFCYENLTKIRKILPEAQAQFLFDEVGENVVQKLSRDRIDADVFYKGLTADNVKMLHDNGIKVNCWTVDDRKIAEQLVSYGVDFITTNILEQA